MIYVIMGVSGCGKSSFGAALSEKLGWPLHEGDDFHPQENINKMARGEALTDQTILLIEGFSNLMLTLNDRLHRLRDRLPWLLRLHQVIERERRSSRGALVACSALKRRYRQILLHGPGALPSSAGPDQEQDQDPAPPVPSPPDVVFLFLHGDYDLIRRRIMGRTGHYMKAELLRSQFDVLEPPTGEENVLPLDVRWSLADMVAEVQRHLGSRESSPRP